MWAAAGKCARLSNDSRRLHARTRSVCGCPFQEPTNHLDLHAVIWLENYLQTWPNTLVVVSHDRDFLNAICTDMLHVWQQKLIHYKGDYEVYYSQFQLKVEQQKEAYEKQQKRLKALKKSGKVTVDVSKTSSRDSATKQKQRAMVTGVGKGKKSAKDSDDEEGPQEELLQPVKDYIVRLAFTSAGGACRTHRAGGLNREARKC